MPEDRLKVFFVLRFQGQSPGPGWGGEGLECELAIFVSYFLYTFTVRNVKYHDRSGTDRTLKTSHLSLRSK